MMSMNKAQAGKKVAKKPVKKRTPHPNDDYKDMVDPATGKKGTMGGEGTRPPFGGPGPKKGTKVYDMGTGKYETVKKNGGPVKKVIKKAKNGAKFPDLNKDGKVTKADILKGRGVIAKKGATIKKAQNGLAQPSTLENYKKMKSRLDKKSLDKVNQQTAKSLSTKKAKPKMKSGGAMKKCKYGCK